VEEIERYLIVGLGNPGEAYAKTRHNVGFHIVQTLAKKQQLSFKYAAALKADVASGEICSKKAVLLQPTTYMNLSGEAVRRCIDYFKIPIDHLIVVCDDVALPLGTMRMRSKGSSGGHNGLKNIEAHLGTEYYVRLRIGVSAPAPGEQELDEYVLGKFSQEEMAKIEEITMKAVASLELWLAAGIAAAMQAANTQNEET
jgi:PTH1 family peptidyl-tRNA hydrolase